MFKIAWALESERQSLGWDEREKAGRLCLGGVEGEHKQAVPKRLAGCDWEGLKGENKQAVPGRGCKGRGWQAERKGQGWQAVPGSS